MLQKCCSLWKKWTFGY